MASRWLPGSDEFSPSKCAATVKAGVGLNADPEEKERVKGMLDYNTAYLRAIQHKDGNRPSSLPDGTVVYYSWQAATMARYFLEVYGRATARHDDNEHERTVAREDWKTADWNAVWDSIAEDERLAVPPV